MTKLPSAIWVVDTKKEHLAVAEARKLGIPVVAILDTNCDPDEVDYKIPGNDDAIRSIGLLTRVIADAAVAGLAARSAAAVAVADKVAVADEQFTEVESALAATGAPVVETPVVETPVVETPVVETPVVETPVVETPVVETPVVETPVVEEVKGE